jgi:hypothetical protein
MAVALDKIDMMGGTMIREGAWTKELTRLARVTGLPDGDASKGMDAALSSGVLPAAWSVHPTVGAGCLHLVSYSLQADTPFSCIVTMRYVNTAIRYYSGAGTLRTIQTNLDRDGNRVWVYCEADDANTDPEHKQPGILTVTTPEAVLQCRCIQGSRLVTGGIDPLARARDYVNTVNANPWKGGNAGWWLCDGIEFDAGDLGDIAWNMCYTFRLNRYGWQPRAVYMDRETGEPHAGIVEGIGNKTVDYFPVADFDALGLGTMPGSDPIG